MIRLFQSLILIHYQYKMYFYTVNKSQPLISMTGELVMIKIKRFY
jgi:hypothetical protein